MLAGLCWTVRGKDTQAKYSSRSPNETFYGHATQRTNGIPIHDYSIYIRKNFRRTILEEREVPRRCHYLTAHNSNNKQLFVPPAAFETNISAGERRQTNVLDRTATWTGRFSIVQHSKLQETTFCL